MIIKCPNCFWHDYYWQDLSYIWSPNPRGEKLHQRVLSGLWSNYTQKSEDFGNQFLFSFQRGERRRRLLNFLFLSNRCVFSCIWLFLSLVFNKALKTVSRVRFYCERLLVACFNWSFLRFLLYCVFIIISQSSKNESAARRQ